MGKHVTGTDLIEMARGALDSLKVRRHQIDNLNVFPVPDGDTGTNMYFTLLTGCEQMSSYMGEDIVGISAALSHGTLMGSRGNSGVILSQIMEGLNRAVAEHGRMDIESMCRGIALGTELAYMAVMSPEEGTVLTVVRETTEGLSGLDDEIEVLEFWENAVDLGRASLMRTPEILPPLKEAGVVDSGGAGLVAIWEGFYRGLGGQREWDWQFADSIPRMEKGVPAGHHIQLLVECDDRKAQEIKDRLRPLGDSVIVAGMDGSYQVHIHTVSTDKVLETTGSLARITHVEVSELSGTPVFPAHLFERHEGEQVRVAVLAFAQGDGLIKQFEDMGANVLVGGPGARPSVEYIADAIRRTPGEEIIILPNDMDSVPATAAALDRIERRARILPTESPVSGLAAMEAYLEDGEPERVYADMSRSASRVTWGYVARAERGTMYHDRKVEMGDWLGIRGGEIVAVDSEPTNAALGLIESLGGVGSHLLTILWGEGFKNSQIEAIVGAVARAYPSLGVEALEGGQPFYSLIIGLE